MIDEPRVGVGVIVRRGEQLLLVQRRGVHGSGTWSTPGGHLDPGETPEACAHREPEEETGVTVRNVRFRAVTNDVFESEGRHYVTIWMDAEYDSGEAAVVSSHEISEVAWTSWDALPDELFLSLANLIAGRCYPTEGGGLESLRTVDGRRHR